MDLAQEGRHLWQFNYNFRKQRRVRFPYPIYPLVSPEVRSVPAPRHVTSGRQRDCINSHAQMKNELTTPEQLSPAHNLGLPSIISWSKRPIVCDWVVRRIAGAGGDV